MFVYILASQRNGTLYVGVTNNLSRRIYEHKENAVQGFSAKYHTHRLVYFEVYQDTQNAIRREKVLKHWKREWKINLIEEKNPDWNDLFDTIVK